MFKMHYVKLFFVPILWGGALVAGRVVAPNLPPFTTAFLRFLAVSLFLLPFLYAREGISQTFTQVGSAAGAFEFYRGNDV
ncbi:MAG: EamA family transporter [Spirochaetia bacterium]|nr:EamA family transporter [Spirochaetia bacterium]